MNSKAKKRIIVVGGGAAGCFFAANISNPMFEVWVPESSSQLMQKVKISGGGRCNVTHRCFEPKGLVQFYPRGAKELLSVFTKFQPKDTIAWFKNRGVSIIVEADGRMFPSTHQSQTIMNCIINEAKKNGVRLYEKHSVSSIKKSENGFLITTNQSDFTADFVVLATGSSPRSMAFPKDFGHTIIPLIPPLFTFNIQDKLIEELPGISFKNVHIFLSSEKIKTEGALLITHWGLSGPAILKMSSIAAKELNHKNYQTEIRINFVGLSFENTRSELEKMKEFHAKKICLGTPPFGLVKRFWERCLVVLSIPREKLWSEISKKEIAKLTELLCNYSFSVSGKSTNKDEFVTCGGVDLREINFSTMECKITPGVFLLGELLSIDALTSGFNFQACWSEAIVAAKHFNQLQMME